MNSANWNLEAHSAEALKDFWELGSLGAIPAGQSVVDGDGKIPYLPEALAQRDENRAGWPKADPETTCYLPGIPRATYMPYPFQIVQGGGNILFVYYVREREPPREHGRADQRRRSTPGWVSRTAVGTATRSSSRRRGSTA